MGSLVGIIFFFLFSPCTAGACGQQGAQRCRYYIEIGEEEGGWVVANSAVRSHLRADGGAVPARIVPAAIVTSLRQNPNRNVIDEFRDDCIARTMY